MTNMIWLLINIYPFLGKLNLMSTTRLKGKTLRKARKLLVDIVDYLEEGNIDYHLEGGTLLGFVRDGDFLEWDHDIDLSIPVAFAEKFYSGRYRLWMKGYRVTRRRSIISHGPIREGDLRIFKVKGVLHSFLKLFSGKLKESQLVADIFLKFDDGSDVYWIAKERLMKVTNRFYEAYEEVEYNGRRFRAPSYYKDYLTAKYGDWSVPVKEWNCADDENTVIMKTTD